MIASTIDADRSNGDGRSMGYGADAGAGSTAGSTLVETVLLSDISGFDSSAAVSSSVDANNLVLQSPEDRE